MQAFVLNVYHPHCELIGVYSSLEKATSACPNGPHKWSLEPNGYEWSCDWADSQVTYVITVKEMDK